MSGIKEKPLGLFLSSLIQANASCLSERQQALDPSLFLFMHCQAYFEFLLICSPEQVEISSHLLNPCLPLGVSFSECPLFQLSPWNWIPCSGQESYGLVFFYWRDKVELIRSQWKAPACSNPDLICLLLVLVSKKIHVCISWSKQDILRY